MIYTIIKKGKNTMCFKCKKNNSSNQHFASIERESIDPIIIEEFSDEMDTFFEYNVDINKTAYMNWNLNKYTIRRNFAVLGKSFFSTAFSLMQICLQDNNDKKADDWIFPIMFSIVHGIEVYLKVIIVSLNIILDKETKKIEGKHDIRQLAQGARKLIIQFNSSEKSFDSKQMLTAIKVINNFIDIIYEKTDDMTFARYPMSRKKKGNKNPFYLEVFGNEVVDMELFNKEIVAVFHMLDYLFEITDEMVENKGVDIWPE